MLISCLKQPNLLVNIEIRGCQSVGNLRVMPENLIERYLIDMGEVRGTRSNVPETSFYSVLEGLLTDIGKTLSPKVRCVINLSNRGAGLPDGGLFSAD
jgi:hypothetical protein